MFVSSRRYAGFQSVLLRASFLALVLPRAVWPTGVQNAAPAAPPSHASVPETQAKPLPPPDWKTLKAAYDYSPKAAGKVEAEVRDDPDYLRVHLTFSNPSGQRVTGLFLRPKASGVYPVALLLHGLGGTKETIVARFGKTLLAQGIATLSLDADRHGERKRVETSAPSGLDFLKVIGSGVVEYRQAFDYVQTRPDVDRRRIGLAGYSMGAMEGAILSGVETRIRAAVLFVGGDLVQPRIATLPESVRPFLQTVSPANYVGHISPRPVLLINGEQDTTVPKAAALLVQAAARRPKEIRWINGGHELPVEDIRKGVEALADRLKRGVSSPPGTLH